MINQFEEYVCYCCQGNLRFNHNELSCEKCNKIFSIKNNIPRFVNQSNYTNSFGFQWNLFRKTQLDSHTNKDISRDRVSKVIDFGEDISSHSVKILEAGSGAGRFTEIIAEEHATVYTFDYSNAIDANYENNKKFSNLNFFQADILDIPFKDNYFDIIICFGVIQHTESPYSTFSSLVKKLKPGGKIYIDVYSKNWHTYLWSKYILRPVTTRIPKEILFKYIKQFTPMFIPITRFLKSCFGKVGMRISPIVEYSELGLSEEQNKEWSILDTFDMYSPKYDLPQSINEVTKWFKESNLRDISVKYGPNGIIGKGIKK